MDTTNIFTVTPMSQKIELEAGQVYEGSIVVANPANAANDFHYKVEVSPYGVIGEDYLMDLSNQSEYSQIANWIEIDEPTGTLKPNETRDIYFTITVPENAPSGGQYAALMVSSENNNTASSGLAINNVFEMASVIYAKIAGETVRAGEVSSFSIPGFVTGMPITTGVTITNDGNSHETAKIALEIKSFFAASPLYPTPEDDGIISELILPNTTRYITRDIDGISSLGIYEVKETVNYLGQNTTFTQTVVSCPIWFMALVFVTVMAVIVAIVRTVRAHRIKHKVF